MAPIQATQHQVRMLWNLFFSFDITKFFFYFIENKYHIFYLAGSFCRSREKRWRIQIPKISRWNFKIMYRTKYNHLFANRCGQNIHRNHGIKTFRQTIGKVSKFIVFFLENKKKIFLCSCITWHKNAKRLTSDVYLRNYSILHSNEFHHSALFITFAHFYEKRFNRLWCLSKQI